MSTLNRRHVIKTPPEVTESPISKLPRLVPLSKLPGFCSAAPATATEAPLASGASEAHCGQLGSEGRFLAGEQNSWGWQALIKTVEVEDIKRRPFLDQPEIGCLQTSPWSPSGAGEGLAGDAGGSGLRHLCFVEPGRGHQGLL